MMPENQITSFRNFCENSTKRAFVAMQILATLKEEERKDMDGPFRAFDATCEFLKELHFFLDARMHPERTRNEIFIGFVKETPSNGNTSVSMGTAVEYFKKNPSEQGVMFLNCGTGGIKYQLYLKNGCNYTLKEYKPKNGASVQGFQLQGCGYTPKQPVQNGTFRQMLEKEFKNTGTQQGIKVFAFITGTIREYFEKLGAGSEERKMLENHCAEQFQEIAEPLDGSYFMTQEAEGVFESIACREMYRGLAQDGKLPKDIQVMGTIGIGRGSCQFSLVMNGGGVKVIGHKAGMSSPAEQLKDMKYEAMRQIFDMGDAIHEVFANGSLLITIKSGPAILLENPKFVPVVTALTKTHDMKER